MLAIYRHGSVGGRRADSDGQHRCRCPASVRDRHIHLRHVLRDSAGRNRPAGCEYRQSDQRTGRLHRHESARDDSRVPLDALEAGFIVDEF